jgi:hypothetical protein
VELPFHQVLKPKIELLLQPSQSGKRYKFSYCQRYAENNRKELIFVSKENLQQKNES